MDEVARPTADMYINGEWVAAPSGKRFAVRNPATLEPIAEVADGGREEVRAAVEAAHAAFPAWAATTGQTRGALLHRAAEILTARREALATLLTKENGKPLRLARAEIDVMADQCEWSGQEARRIYGRFIPPANPRHRIFTFRQPVGVVAALPPFNAPGSQVTRKVAPALAAGCTVVVRPPRATPLLILETFKILAEAGIPKGVANVVTGTDSAGMGDELVIHPRVRKVSFTGSTAVGKALLARAAGGVKRVTLELGGHAPFLVFEDADLDKAAEGAARSGFNNSGQICVSANRILVHRAVAEAFIQRLAAIARRLRVGDGLVPGTDLGPMIDKAGFDKVVEHVEDARSRGAAAVAGGRAARVTDGLKGYFYEPTVLAGADLSMRVMHEETFGPVLPIMAFDTEEEAVRVANDTSYGLAAYFFTRDVGRAFRVAEQLQFGIVGVNELRAPGAHIPFGGMKESGLGRENGPDVLDPFLETKSVVIGL